MSELSPEVRALLAQAGAQHDPSERDLERGLSTLHASLAFSAPALVASSASAASAAPVAKAVAKGTLLGAHAAKLYVVAAVLIGSAGAVAVWPKAPPQRAPTPALRAEHTPEATPLPAPTAKLEPQNPVAEPAPTKPSTRARSRDVAAELLLIEAAQHALQLAQPARALRQLDQHARRYPHGRLVSEREGLRAIALCEEGGGEQGRRARDAFLAHHADTPIATRVRKACP